MCIQSVTDCSNACHYHHSLPIMSSKWESNTHKKKTEQSRPAKTRLLRKKTKKTEWSKTHVQSKNRNCKKKQKKTQKTAKEKDSLGID